MRRMRAMSRMCPRCGKPGQADAQFCPHCGAPLNAPKEPDGQGGRKVNAFEGMRTLAAMPAYAKLLFAMLGVLAVGVAVLVVLLLDQPPVKTASASAAPSMQVFAASPSPTPLGSPKPTPTAAPPVSEKVIGTWVATRVDANSKKSKEYQTESATGAYQTYITFLPDGSSAISSDQMDGLGPQLTVRAWYAEGESVYIDYGMETIADRQMFGRTRFFFREGELVSVYTLDGKEVSDFIVFAWSPDQTSLPGNAPETGEDEKYKTT